MESQYAPTSLTEVRLAVLRQHTQLAQLFDELEQRAQAVIACTGGGIDDEARALKEALSVLVTRFSRHLEYEEANLRPWLTSENRGTLLSDHDDQRQRARGLVHDRDVFADPRTLARAALAFVHALRKDMAEEEAQLRAVR
jgi:hypothetical protein